MTLFTGSSRVADKLAVDLKGRIKLEDAGFDWKVLGPDVREVISSITPHTISAPSIQNVNFIPYLLWLLNCRKTMLHGFVIKMLMLVVAKSVQHSRYCLCMRFNV